MNHKCANSECVNPDCRMERRINLKRDGKYCCPGCRWEVEHALVKDEERSFYVPKSYRFYEDTGKERSKKYFEDSVARDNIPSAKFCEKVGMWALYFTSADFAGYDVANFVVYFKEKQDLIDAIFRRL